MKTDAPIRLIDMALTTSQFLVIKNYTANNGEVIADSLHRAKDRIEADFFHTKETNEKIAIRNAVDLTVWLLRNGIVPKFLDGDVSLKVIENVSPPLYDRYYKLVSGGAGMPVTVK